MGARRRFYLFNGALFYSGLWLTMRSRPIVVAVRLTASEHSRLLEIFNSLGIRGENMSECLRILFRKEYLRSVLDDMMRAKKQ